MASHSSPNDPKKFTMVAFIAFVVLFVFTMLIMLWQGDYEKGANGEIQYNTKVTEPSGAD